MGGELGRRRHERRFLRAAESRAGESEEELSERSGLLTTGTGHFDKIIIGTNEMGNTGYASAWRRAHTKLRQAAHEEDERGVNFTMMEKETACFARDEGAESRMDVDAVPFIVREI